MAAAGHVNAADLAAVLTAIETGAALTPEQVNLLGRFNAAIDAAMDGGFELADQEYRNAAKLWAGIAAVSLALCGGAILKGGVSWGAVGPYVFSTDGLRALLVGIVAVPLAPVVKNLSSSLQAAVTAMKAVKG